MKDRMEINNISSSEQRTLMVNWFLNYAKRIDSKKVDEGMIPPYVLNDLGRNGFFGMGIPKQYGGSDLNVEDILKVLELLAATDMSIAILILDSLLSAYTINNFASEDIKESYLSDMASGRALSAVAITEKVAGSNPRAMETFAEKDEDGNWVINGQKRWVGYASWASFINVYAQTYENGEPVGISGFFIPIETEGIEIKEEAQTMGIKGFPKHEVHFSNVKVPNSNVLGPIGKGMESAQSTFMFIRLCMGGLCLGAIKRLIQISTSYAYNRTIATGSLLDNPTSRITLTNLVNGASALESLTNFISNQLDQGIEIPEPAFIISKTFGGELLSYTADKSIQLLGARGYEEANMVAQMYRDGRPFRIFEGPTEVLINYLGTQAYFETGEVYQFLENNLQNKEASNRLQRIVKNIKDKYQRISIFEGNDENVWVYSVIGEISQWLVLSSIIEFEGTQSDNLKQWINAKLEEAIRHYEVPTAEENSLISSQGILKIVHNYNQSVGNLKVTRYGYNNQVDDLLQQPTIKTQLSEKDAQKVLYDWNEEDSNETSESLASILENVAKQFPNQVALEHNNQSLTYAEMNQQAAYIASILSKKGVKEGDFVGICCDRSFDMIISILAVIKLGAGYVPLDKAFPTQRILAITKETSLNFILTQSHIENVAIEEHQLIFVDNYLEEAKLTPSLLSDFELEIKDYNNQNPAYTIFTSGSTGIPKGVLISHQAVANFALSSAKKYQMTPQDRMLQFASISFDAAVEEIFATFVSGAALVLRTEDMLNSYQDFLNQTEAWNISILDLPTAFWTNLVTDSSIQNQSHFPTSVRILIVGGDKVTEKGMKHWDLLSTDHVEFWDTYGPTEATVVAVSKLLRSPEMSENQKLNTTLTIGRPDENVCVYILNEELEPVAIGEAGELHIGGANLGSYLNRPELNNEKFIPNPFTTEHQKAQGFNLKLYKSGDLVKYNKDGDIVFLGRKDNQVKIRGYRVELGEVEAKLNNHPNVKEGVVLANKRNGFKELVAAVVFHKEDANSMNEIKSFLESELPKFMVPSHLFDFASFPMTISKKIDRKSILKSIQKDIEAKSQTLGGDDTVSIIRNIWQSLLGVEVDSHSNFFSVGGHSLSVMQLIGQINQLFEVSVSVKEFYRNQTIHELSELVETKLRRNNNASEIPSKAISQCAQIESLEYPLSKSQTQFFLHSQMHANVPLYNEPCMLSVEKNLNKEELELALNQMISRHEILRTSFHSTEDGLIQKCQEQVLFTVNYLDLSKKNSDAQQSEMKAIAQESLVQLFDIERPCLMRCHLFKISKEDYRIFFVFHHLIIDGLSLFSIFLPELELLLNKNTKQLFPLNCNHKYGKYAAQNVEISEQTRTYWQAVLENPSKLVLPVDNKVDLPSQNGAQFCESFDLKQLNELSQSLQCSRFNVITTALSILLAQYSQKESVSIGTITSTRPAEMSHTLGVFLNTILLKTDFNKEESVKDYAQRVQDALIDAQEHAIPFEDLVKLAQGSGQSDLVEVAVVYEPVHHGKSIFNIDRTFVHSGTSKFNLMFEFEEKKNGLLSLRTEYNSDLFSETSIEMMINHLETILNLMQETNRQIGSFDFLKKEEKQACYSEAQSHLPVTCHALFEQQVEETPDNVALTFEETELTYQQLNQLANQIAHYLINEGIQKGDLVGLYMPRSIEQIATVIAILKAGGVYVPLDPAYPKERLQYIAQKTGIVAFITDSTLPSLEVEAPAYIYLNQEMEIIANQKATNPELHLDFDHLAYVVFTSGSTGLPKGAMVSHHTLSNLMQWQVERSPRDNKTIQFTPLSFDVSFQEIFSTLASGGELVLVKDEIRKNPVSLIEFIIENKVSRLFLPFVAMKQMAEIVEADLAPVPTCLREVITAGEQLKVTADIRSFFSKMPNCLLDNQYGPCETHVVTGGILYPENVADWPALPAIGAPISNVDLLVLNQTGQAVPANIPGELYIAIESTAFGYFQNEEETNKRFIEIENRIYYRTGDIVRFDHEGVLHWLDRVDNQLKIRGFRIETGEVECALSNEESVAQAVVTAIRHGGEKILVAYLQLLPEYSGQIGSLAEFHASLKQNLSSRLPAYMIPVHFKIVDQFELTPSGKVARKLLPSFDLTESLVKMEISKTEETQVSNKVLSPQKAISLKLEQDVIEHFSEVLKLEKQFISRDSNFFNIGGSSLTGFILITRLSKQFSIKLNPSMLVSYSSPRSLADLIANSSSLNLSSLVVLRKEGSLPPIFLVPGTGGTLMSFEHLLKQLPENRPVYGFMHPKLRGADVDCPEIQDLANYYIQCMEEENKTGNCYILGHSFGGVVAYEMCQTLENKGISAIPIILDVPVPQESTRTLTDDWNYADWVAAVGDVLTRKAGTPLQIKDELKNMTEPQALECLKKALVDAQLFSATEDLSNLKDLVDMIMEFEISFLKYHPNFFENDLYLVRATTSSDLDEVGILNTGCNIENWGWEKFVKNVEITWVEGDHLSILNEGNVSGILDVMEACFKKYDSSLGEFSTSNTTPLNDNTFYKIAV